MKQNSNSVEKKNELIYERKHKKTQKMYFKKTQNICSLKTQKYNIPKDVYIFETYQNMLKEVDLIFPSMPKKVDLNPIEKKIRKDIIFQMRNFLIKFKLNQLCLFHSIYLMDKLLAKKIKMNIIELGITCLLISVKFIDIDGNIPPIKYFLEILKPTNQKISKKDLINLEIKCLKTLNYKLSIPQPIDFINLILMNGIVFNTDILESKIKLNSSIYNMPIQIYDEIISFNPDYLQFHPLFLAFACISLSRNLYNLNKWDPFIKVFNVSFSQFEEVYQFIFDLYNECKEKNKNEEILKKKENKKIIYVKEKSSSQVDVFKNNKNINNENNNFVKSERKINNKNEIDIKSLRHYYINKTKSLNINFEQLDYLIKPKKENNENENLSTSDSIKRNVIDFPKKISLYQKYKNKELKVNQSYNNNVLNIDNSQEINNLKNESEIETNIFYNPLQKKSNLNKYSVLNSLNSTLSKAKKNFLKNVKNSSISFLNNSLNNSSISFQIFNNSFSKNNIQSYQIKVLPKSNNKITLTTETFPQKKLFI